MKKDNKSREKAANKSLNIISSLELLDKDKTEVRGHFLNKVEQSKNENI